MKILATIVVALALGGTALLAHGGNEHVRGVVTQVSAQAITVQTVGKTRTLTITDKTAFKRAGKEAHLADIKVGDRVVVDVPEKKNDALLVQIGAAAAAAPHK
jgi:ribosomal protein S1